MAAFIKARQDSSPAGAGLFLFLLGFSTLVKGPLAPVILGTCCGTLLLLFGGWVIVISSSFDVWENNRARFDIGPVLLIGALICAVRLLDRRRMAQSPPGRRTIGS